MSATQPTAFVAAEVYKALAREGRGQEERMTGTQRKITSGREALHRSANTGPAFWGPGDTYTFLATGKETQGAYFQLGSSCNARRRTTSACPP